MLRRSLSALLLKERSLFSKVSSAVKLCNKRNYSIDLKLVKTVKKNVKPFGALEVREAFFDLVIKPANPDDFPDMDTVVMKVYSTASGGVEPEFQLVDGESSVLKLQTSGKSNQNLRCQLELPIKYDINAEALNNCSITVENMEPECVELRTQRGDIRTRSLKSTFAHLESGAGNISCGGVMQGSVKMKTQSGDIKGKRFQGPKVEMQTSSGSIEVDSVYSDVSSFQTESGNLHLKNLHQESEVTVLKSGNVKILGLDGSIRASLGQGLNEIQISQLRQDSSIVVHKGQLRLKLPEEHQFGLEIHAESVTLPESLKDRTEQLDGKTYVCRKESQFSLNVTCEEGEVVVENQDWFSALGLKFKD